METNIKPPDGVTSRHVRIENALAGRSLYGDDFCATEIEQWFVDEREGYFNLYFRDAAKESPQEPIYTYAAVAAQHGYRWLEKRQYTHALGIGSAHGAELQPVLDRSARVTVLEPSDGFAATQINGKPVAYIKPQSSGLMPFADSSFDLIICFSVLHHIPNVSTVLREIQRVLAPGGHALLREPTHSMGDWRISRRGLTKNERGIPLPIFRSMLDSIGLKIIRETRCMFSVIPRLEPLYRAWNPSLDVRCGPFHRSYGPTLGYVGCQSGRTVTTPRDSGKSFDPPASPMFWRIH